MKIFPAFVFAIERGLKGQLKSRAAVRWYLLLPGGVLLTWAKLVCAAPRGMVFELFWSEKGYRF